MTVYLEMIRMIQADRPRWKHDAHATAKTWEKAFSKEHSTHLLKAAESKQHDDHWDEAGERAKLLKAREEGTDPIRNYLLARGGAVMAAKIGKLAVPDASGAILLVLLILLMTL